MLTSQMGIVAKNGGVDVATAFLRPKITIAITVCTGLYSESEIHDYRVIHWLPSFQWYNSYQRWQTSKNN